MDFEEIIQNKSIVTTVSMPMPIYLQLIEISKSEGISISGFVRRALIREFEAKGERLEKCD